MKKRLLSVLLCLCMVMALLPATALATGGGSTSISNFTELQAAFNGTGGTYTLTDNITVEEQLTLASGRTLIINGNGHTIQPAVTGLNEQGVVNSDASVIANIIDNQGALTLENLTIYGGKGRCISNSGTLTMTGVSLERAHLTSGYGAGLYNDYGAKALLTNCNIRRNGCDSSGGGFYNNGTLILESCAIVENRNFGAMKGGGAGENGGTLYMNNCTVANNQSSEVGGGLNNYGGTAYIMNSTFTGNVTTYTNANYGGGIGYHGGKLYAVNSVFAFNYANGVASDIGIYSGTDVYLYNCAYGTIQGTATTKDCITLSGEVSTLFNGAYTSGIVDENGNENAETTFARPVITQNGSTYGVYPAESSELKSGGTKTYYECDSTNFTVKMSFNSSSTNTALGSLEVASTVVTRPNASDTSGLIGALPSNITITPMYTVKVNPAEPDGSGTVTGGSAQGNSYPAGTGNISITAVPNEGYDFSGWKVGSDTTIRSTSNPYQINSLGADVTLTPVFAYSTIYRISLDTTVYTFAEAAVGYGEQQAKTVTVTNTGNSATGALTVALSGSNASSFTLNKNSITDIAAGSNAAFTVVPNTGLSAGTYTATVTVSGSNSMTASFDVSFTVNNATPAHSITLSPSGTYTFTAATVGYGAQTPLTVTVTNTGTTVTGTLDLRSTGNTSQFELSPIRLGSLAPGETATFTVAPKTGLAANSPYYTLDIIVYDAYCCEALATLNVKFTVNSSDGGGGYTPPSSSDGYYTPPTYKVESEVTEDTDGSVSFSTGSAKKGDAVTITVTPDPYYKVDGVVVRDKNGNEIAVTDNKDGTFTFQMPASKVTVEPFFSWENPFTDVAEDAYYTPAVEWVLKNGITSGTGDGTTFSPDDICTRAQMVTFLWNAAGKPKLTGDSATFTDVPTDAYYAKAVQWAVEQGVTAGTSGESFSPDADCTRAQMVTFLWNVAGKPEPAGNSVVFTDVPADAYYAKAVQWAAEQGITQGTSAVTFSPDAPCTRAQMAAFLWRSGNR